MLVIYVKVVCSSECRNGKVETESFRSAGGVGCEIRKILQVSKSQRLTSNGTTPTAHKTVTQPARTNHFQQPNNFILFNRSFIEQRWEASIMHVGFVRLPSPRHCAIRTRTIHSLISGGSTEKRSNGSSEGALRRVGRDTKPLSILSTRSCARRGRVKTRTLTSLRAS